MFNISIIRRESRQASSAIEKQLKEHSVNAGDLVMIGCCGFVRTQKGVREGDIRELNRGFSVP